YNGPLECTYYQFHGPRPPRGNPKANDGEAEMSADIDTPSSDSEAISMTSSIRVVESAPPARQLAEPVFGGLLPASNRQAEEFANRLRNRARHLRRWPTRRGITCYRLYERDVADVPLVVDRYEDALHIAEFARPHERSPGQHADWLDLMVR